jgi:hypothetical protein
MRTISYVTFSFLRGTHSSLCDLLFSETQVGSEEEIE